MSPLQGLICHFNLYQGLTSLATRQSPFGARLTTYPRLRFGLVYRTLGQKAQATQARYKVPLVLGMPRKRGSVSTASRNARAVALKMASAM